MATTQLRSINSLQEVISSDNIYSIQDPHLVTNTQRMEDGHSGYLAMLSPPDFEHLSSLHECVNNEIYVKTSLNPTNTSGYMCMKSSYIFSPRLAEDPIFSFDVYSDRKHKNSIGEGAAADAVHEDYANPTYHIPPSIKEETSVDIVKSADNYINMPQSKSAIKNDSV